MLAAGTASSVVAGMWGRRRSLPAVLIWFGGGWYWDMSLIRFAPTKSSPASVYRADMFMIRLASSHSDKAVTIA